MGYTNDNITSKYTMAERRQNVEAWLADLESGKFKQTQHMLAQSGGFCCLGVACKTLKAPEEVFKTTKFGAVVEDFIEFWGAGSNLPVQAQDALGIATENGDFIRTPTKAEIEEGYSIEERIHESLVGLNDDYQQDFATIAKVISSHPKGLFVEGMYPTSTPLPDEFWDAFRDAFSGVEPVAEDMAITVK